jgi:lipopolysaccharide export LptBFGC system permease protein LptF
VSGNAPDDHKISELVDSVDDGDEREDRDADGEGRHELTEDVAIQRLQADTARQIASILRARAESGIEERVFSAGLDKVVIYTEELDPRRRSLRRLVIADERHSDAPRIFVAREGQFLDSGQGRLTLQLRSGAFSDGDAGEPKSPRLIAFDKVDITVTTESPDALMDRLRQRPRELPLLRLLRRAKGADGNGDEGTTRTRSVEAHKRFALPLIPLAFVIVGYPIAMLAERRGRAIAWAGVLTVAVGYYVIFCALEGAAIRGGAPAVVIWVPNLLFGSLGAGLL